MGRFYQGTALCACFGLGAVIGLLLWNPLNLPYHNPDGIVGLASEQKINPHTDSLRFFLLISLPSFLLFLLYLLKFAVPPGLFSKEPCPQEPFTLSKGYPFWKLSFFSLLLAFNAHTYHASGKFDSFHEGESLGPAVSILHGAKPYRDVLFFHGAFQDPLRSVWAFQIFGRSIGAQRTLYSMVKLAAWFLLAHFLGRLFGSDRRWVFVILAGLALIYVGFFFNVFVAPFLTDPSPEGVAQAFLKHENLFLLFHWVLIAPKEAVTFLFLLLASLVKTEIVPVKKEEGKARFGAYSFIFAFVPAASTACFLDRGLYLSAIYALLWPVIFFFMIPASFRKIFLASSFLGFLAGSLVLGAILQWQWGPFFKSLPWLSETSEFSAKIPYPIGQKTFAAVLLLIAFNLFWLNLKFLREWRSRAREEAPQIIGAFGRRYFLEIILALMSVLFFFNAMERSDWEHVCYSIAPAYLLFAALAIQNGRRPFLKPGRFSRAAWRVLMFFFVLLVAGCGFRFFHQDLWAKNFPVQTPDSAFISTSDQAAISFLKARMGPEDGFFTLTSEAAWYYFLGKPCPTRFPYDWIASREDSQREIVEDLRRKKVKWVLYRDTDWSWAVDGIDNEKRFPFIVQFLRENYVPYATIDGHEIWTLKKKS